MKISGKILPSEANLFFKGIKRIFVQFNEPIHQKKDLWKRQIMPNTMGDLLGFNY